MKIGATELIVIFIVALLVIGPDKLPYYAKKLGSALKEFKKVSADMTKDVRESVIEPLEEAQKPLREAIEPLEDLNKDIRESLNSVEKDLKGIGKPTKKENKKKEEKAESADEAAPTEEAAAEGSTAAEETVPEVVAESATAEDKSEESKPVTEGGENT